MSAMFFFLCCSYALIGLDLGAVGIRLVWFGHCEVAGSTESAYFEHALRMTFRYLLGCVARYRPRLKKPMWRKSSSMGITPLRMS